MAAGDIGDTEYPTTFEELDKKESGPEGERHAFSAPTTEELIHTQQKQKEGNCTFEDPEEFISKVPQTTKYFSVSCDNSQITDVELERWTGIFPSNLLREEVQSLKQGDKISIDVMDQEIPDDYEGDEAYQTLFTGNEFFKAPIIGRWGTSLEDIEDSSIVIYKVEIVGAGDSKNFYISKKA